MRRTADISVGRTTAEELMRHAVSLTGDTHPHPNPRVGAVIVTEEGDVLASGAHRAPGQPHAERLAIGDRRFPGATMVVTLEPCSHTGRTPPCVEAIIDAGIARVIVGAIDPDPRVSGSGIKELEDAGIEVVADVLADEVEANDPAYFHHRRTGRPRYTIKVAATLDGQSAALDRTSQWITGPEAREDGHRIRAASDAVVVGAGTVLADDPLLTVRIPGYDGPQPRPVVVKGMRDIPESARVMARDPLIVHSGGEPVAPEALDEALVGAGLLAAMVEGGPTLTGTLIRSGRADEIVWYLGPKLAAGPGVQAIEGTFTTLADAIDLDITAVERIGSDVKITARTARRD